MLTRRHLIAASGTLPIAMFAPAWAATAWPAKPIRIVVPSPAGSPVDAIARKLGELLGKSLGTPVVVDNKPGAIGTIGAGEVARSAADGYAFLFTTSDPLVAASVMVKKLPYDPRSGFLPISKVANSAPALVAHPRVKANSVSELIAEMKAQGNSPSYGSWGPGTIPVQVMESVARQAGVRFGEVPYRGSPPALQDLLGGTVDLTFAAPFVAAPMIAEGKMKALALVGAKRSAVLPNVQTFAEAGFSSYVFTNEIWVGLLAPAGLDAAIQQKVALAVRAAVQGADLSGFLANIGFTPVGNAPAEFERELLAEAAAIPALLRDLGIQPL
ncbi:MULTISPECIES: tripartite tricarboxylate transporter substrate binding protein [unclassified Variovorax]|uniref:Bug family tripartite tricarboxylate transporter substrate binding protein n=1 Tax=unclassified Variovorax TaxID=663243 RepID=UPI001BD49E85|nr:MULTISPECIES: tripartite tricarboxylate transporter substrate binding protein [unclassified Variovorax]